MNVVAQAKQKINHDPCPPIEYQTLAPSGKTKFSPIDPLAKGNLYTLHKKKRFQFVHLAQ
jgi:hypothetical protein